MIRSSRLLIRVFGADLLFDLRLLGLYLRQVLSGIRIQASASAVVVAVITFESGFKTLFGFQPFRWQSRLYADHFVTGELPAGIDVPTGLGKTAVMGIWLLARAENSALPRRLVYVVDRRAVVDQATELAEEIHERLRKPENRELAKMVGCPEDSGVAVSTLRGQLADNRRWQEDPAAPAIIVGTIDMIGSRLLFEGYGVSRKMRPYHAGLLGADTLVLLDEAHLCPPFEAMLQTVATDSGLMPVPGEPRATVPRFRMLPLSATGRNGGPGYFRLQPEDYQPTDQATARDRLGAEKALRLHDLSGDANLEEWLVQAAGERAAGGGRILVYCHSREKARKVADRLEKRYPGHLQMLVGERRARERDGALTRLRETGFVATRDGGSAGAGTEILVATSAGEVGVDLDADHMVCDLVAFERMVQRLGRVNRRGGPGRVAEIEVGCIPPKPPRAGGSESEEKKRERERLHAQEIAAYRARLGILKRLPLRADGRHEANPLALGALKDAAPALVVAATTPAVAFPRLDRAVVEAWSLTSLREHPGRPAPGPWLRGWEEGEEPRVGVLWRHWLPWRAGEKLSASGISEIAGFFEAAPPVVGEVLEAAVSHVLDVLLKRAEAFRKLQPSEQRDACGATTCGVLLLTRALEFRAAWPAIALAGLIEDKRRADVFREQLAESVVIVSAQLGGLDEKGLLSPSASSPVVCFDQGWDDDELKRAGVRVLAPGKALPPGWSEIDRFLLEGNDEEEPDSLVIAALREVEGALEGDLAVARREQCLAEHQAWVVEEAKQLAEAIALPTAYRDALIAAAGCHDSGKSREFWQNAMGAQREGRPYAKTRSRGTPARLRIGSRTYRHEFGSLAHAERDPTIQSLDGDLRDLVLHLVASHHGHARPNLAPVDPDLPPSSPLLKRRSEEAALRFARLQRRWGPWGLAWWESLLRAADQRASRRLDLGGVE